MPVVGSNYPLTPLKQFLVQCIGTSQLVFIAFVIFASRIFSLLGQEEPAWVRENRWSLCLGVFFVGNMVASSMGSTGAFEIAFDGQPVFSKLATNRMPSVQELFDGIEAIRTHQQ